MFTILRSIRRQTEWHWLYVELLVVKATNQHQRVRVEHNPVEAHDAPVLDAVHDGGLLQELHGVGVHALPAQALDGHLDLEGKQTHKLRQRVNRKVV